MKLCTALLTLALIASQPAFALKEYYSISRSTRALGMGGAFYGLSDDENALFYNPSGLAFYRGGPDFKIALRAEGTTNAVSALQELIKPGTRDISDIVAAMEPYQGQPIYGGVTPGMIYFAKRQFAIGLLIGDVKSNAALLGRDLDSSLDITAIADSGLFVGFGFPILKNLAVGANLKAIFRAGGRKTYTAADIAQSSSFSIDPRQMGGMGGGLDFDLGATYEHFWAGGMFTRASLTLNNALASQMTFIKVPDVNAPPGLPRLLSVGTYTQLPGMGVFDHVGLLVDFAEFGIGGQTDADLGGRGGSFWKHVNLGVEVPLTSYLSGRLGLRQGNFTAGLGLDLRHFELELATYAEELATHPGRLTARRVALRLAFGFGGGKQSVVTLSEASPPPLKAGSAPVPAPAETPPPALGEAPAAAVN